MKYPGGKNAAGTYQRIINQIPPHVVYIEPFAGSAAILRMKRPADRNIAIDLYPGAIDALRGKVPLSTELVVGDGLRFLERYPWQGNEFVYCDPPYLQEVCRSRLRYHHILTRREHERLLKILRRIPCPVMISGYWSELYGRRLAGWRTDHFPQMTRGGYAIEEWLWMNYPESAELHDYRYLGGDYREREKLLRRKKRWMARLARMTDLERKAMLAAMNECSSILEASPRASIAPG